jgi:hypothetical protein
VGMVSLEPVIPSFRYAIQWFYDLQDRIIIQIQLSSKLARWIDIKIAVE